MDISKKEEQELIEWGVRFYELGFKAALDSVTAMGRLAKPMKTEAVRKYIKKISKELESTDEQ